VALRAKLPRVELDEGNNGIQPPSSTAVRVERTVPMGTKETSFAVISGS